MPKYECPRCSNSKGHIKAFDHVQGGVCFKCSGKGYIEQKHAPKKSRRFAIAFLWLDEKNANYKNGEFCDCLNIKAKTKRAAEEKAAALMSSNGSVEYRVTEIEESN